MGMLRDLFIRVRADTGHAEQGLDQLDESTRETIKTFKRLYDQMDEGQREAVRSFVKIDESVKRTAKNVREEFDPGKMLAALGLGSIVKSFVTESLQMFGKFERYSAVLKTAFSDAENPALAAADAMKMVEQFAAQTNFSVDQATDSFIKMKNRGLGPSAEQMMYMADVANATGKDLGQLTEAILDISNSERWNEFGIKAQKMGNQVSLSFKGQRVVVDHTVAGIMDAMKTFGEMQGVLGMTAEISKTFEGRMSNLGDAMDAAKRRVGGFLNLVVGPVLDFFTDAEHGTDRLNTALIFLGSFVLPLTAMAAWAAISPMLPFIGIAAAAAAAITGLALVLEDLWVFANGGDSLFGDFLAFLGFTPEEIQAIQQSLQTFFGWIGQAWDYIVDIVKSNGKVIAAVLGVMLIPVVAPILLIIGLIKGMIYLVRTVPVVWQQAVQAIGTMLDTYIINPLQNMYDMVSTFFIGIFDSLRDGAVAVANSLIDVINMVMGKMAEWSTAPVIGAVIPDFTWSNIPKIEARATGGPVSSGQPYLVGEEGPEIIVPRGSGTVIPNGRIGGASFVLQMNGNIYLTGTTEQAADQFVTKVRDALDELAPEIEAKLGMMPEAA